MTIRIAHSLAFDAEQAAQELYRDLIQPEMALVMFFCSSAYDRSLLASVITRLFGDTQVIGCTTAGEIGLAGLRQHSLSGVSFSADSFTAITGLLTDLQHFEMNTVYSFAQKQLQDLETQAPAANAGNSFGFLLIDGLSVREEPVTHALQTGLGKITLLGGSAGDGLRFQSTYLFFNGTFHTDSAVLLLLNTTAPFKIFKTQHFVPTEQRMVVTAADVSRRVVLEINGLPAAPEYARLVGVNIDDLHPLRFAASPVVVMIDGIYYVRAIQSANPDDSLTFYCAIEEGLVLRVARGIDLLENLQQAFSEVRAAIGQPQLTLACDCILRRLELEQNGLAERAGLLLCDNNVVGFNTYGEQFHGIHVNQTFAAIAIGATPLQNDNV